ncbi:MAG: hypothetical protein B7Z59_00095 [Acidiphilium sp. 37-67-22]|nr:MAG: hypothetical protein B7Z76_15100 [Acidiphilium sp. 20-67-58]OYV88003.1 MAG: hypothetical protein B7Z64_00105 [Acidiphilium sp. 21-68-69]OYW12752.1 MAG: hypothetical protein B7Z59_00095 [Acidiphilium sp. 37-67-22]
MIVPVAGSTTLMTPLIMSAEKSLPSAVTRSPERATGYDLITRPDGTATTLICRSMLPPT